MKRFGWSRPAFLIGFVLATQAESYLNMSVQFYGWSMFLRPGVVIIGTLSLISIYFSRKGGVDENAELMNKEVERKIDLRPQIFFSIAIFAFILMALYDSYHQSFLGGIFPLIIAIICIPFVLWLFYTYYKQDTNHAAIFDAEQAVEEGTFKAPWYEPILWIGGLYVLSVIIGFVPAIIVFSLFFLL